MMKNPVLIGVIRAMIFAFAIGFATIGAVKVGKYLFGKIERVNGFGIEKVGK